MASTYEAALAIATHLSVKTQWQDEGPNVDPVDNRHIPFLQTWLTTLNSPVASEPSIWLAIKSNWISFLAATSKHPTTVLAPNRKRIQWEQGTESDAHARKRFWDDQRERVSIQGAIWRLFDGKEVLVERWPRETRVMMSRHIESNCQTSLKSLMDNFGKQRRFNSVWSSMICFLLYCHEEDGSLETMGLHLSEDLQNELLDIGQALIYEDYPKPGDGGKAGLVEQEIYDFIMNILTDTSATPKTNPLLWWTTVLVRLSLEANGEEDFISRGRFCSNILPMDLNVQQRLEGIVHFAQVFLLDLAFNTWQPIPETQLLEVQSDLNVVDNTWIGKYNSPRPAAQNDGRTCETPAWKSVIKHVEKTFAKYLEDQVGETPMRWIISLRMELKRT
ncbi:hypothetical protein J1614_012198 [Plenodomus biglobosus]|nr:hypothetical protein J1614_012198 [Plenodomus biglobosus]